MSNYLIYLLEVSVCQIAFYLLYRLLFSKQTFFQLNRVYLLSSTLVSFVIPLIGFEVWESNFVFQAYTNPFYAFSEPGVNPGNSLAITATSSGALYFSIWSVLFLLYSIVSLILLVKFLRSLWRVTTLIRQQDVVNMGDYKLVKHDSTFGFFSFSRYLFLNENDQTLSANELQHVIDHEKIHILQQHTVDIIVMELAVIVCWFNPAIYAMRNAIRQTHEFIADSSTVTNEKEKESYARLLVKLSSETNPFKLAHQFSMKSIKNRVIMLNQPKNKPMSALRFSMIIPVIGLLLILFSFTEKTVPRQDNPVAISQEPPLVINEITWTGNTKYSAAYLNEILGLKKGDIYDRESVMKMLLIDPQFEDITSLYMDNGYLFFSVELKEEIEGESINLNFDMYEGTIVKFNQIVFSGNKKISRAQMTKMIDIKKGELFSRAKLIQAQKTLSESGFFKAKEIAINPIPRDDPTLVDVEFVVIEL